VAKKRTSAAEAGLQTRGLRHGWSRALKQNGLFQHPLKPLVFLQAFSQGWSPALPPKIKRRATFSAAC